MMWKEVFRRTKNEQLEFLKVPVHLYKLLSVYTTAGHWISLKQSM